MTFRSTMAAGLVMMAAAVAQAESTLVVFESPGDLRAVCLQTRPLSRLVFEGEGAARSEARKAFSSARTAALEGLYRVRIPADGFSFGAYDPKAQLLPLDFSKPVRAMYGALTLTVPAQTKMAFPMSQSAASAALSGQQARSLALDVSFELDPGVLCRGSTATDVYELGARIVAVQLRDGLGAVLARTESPLADRHRRILGGYSGVPTVSIGSVQSGEGMDAVLIQSLMRALSEPARRCYVARLDENPNAAGGAVLGVVVGEAGQVESVQFVSDALKDQALRECLETALTGLRFDGVQGRFQAPVEFKLAPRP